MHLHARVVHVHLTIAHVGRRLEELSGKFVVGLLDVDGTVEGRHEDLSVGILDGHLVDDGKGLLVGPCCQEGNCGDAVTLTNLSLDEDSVHRLGSNTADDLGLLVTSVLPLNNREGNTGTQSEGLDWSGVGASGECDDHYKEKKRSWLAHFPRKLNTIIVYRS